MGDVSAKFPATLEKGSPSVLILRYSSSFSTPLSRSFLYSVSVCSHVSSQSPRPAPVPRSFSRIRTITTIPQATTAKRINELISNGTKLTCLPLKSCLRIGNRGLSPRIHREMCLPTSFRRLRPPQATLLSSFASTTLFSRAAKLNGTYAFELITQICCIGKARFSETNGRYRL